MLQLVDELKSQMNSQIGSVTFIGIAGGSASGKSTIGELIREFFKNEPVASVSVDLFYKDITPEIIEHYDGRVNFDDPFMIDQDELMNVLLKLQQRQSVKVPLYDYSQNKHSEESVFIPASDIILVEGIFSFYWPEINKLCSLKIFVDCSGETRLIRRIRRDIAERGREINGILKEYETFVKPAYDNFVVKQKKMANLVLPWEQMNNDTNFEAVEMLINHISCLTRRAETPRSK